MCIVIDANVLRSVFNSSDARHCEFIPLFNWIIAGEGKMVFGGAKYQAELAHVASVRSLVVELSRRRKVVRVSDCEVDRFAHEFKRIEPSAEFDDPHIVAIFRVSRCLLFCSDDVAAGFFVQDRRFYPKGRVLPKIYKRRAHRRLLCPSNIAPCCC